MRHEIVVSNIGTVYDGLDGVEATAIFNHYVFLSREARGRVHGESVTWIEDGIIRCEADGSLYQEPF